MRFLDIHFDKSHFHISASLQMLSGFLVCVVGFWGGGGIKVDYINLAQKERVPHHGTKSKMCN